jgi:hypothetical protein
MQGGVSPIPTTRTGRKQEADYQESLFHNYMIPRFREIASG